MFDRLVPFTTLQTLNFLPWSRINSPNSGAGKALREALRTVACADGCQCAFWARKVGSDEEDAFVITIWSSETHEVEFFASETWGSTLNELRGFLLPSATSGDYGDRQRYRQFHGPGFSPLNTISTREHEIITFNFRKAAATSENISEFNLRVSNFLAAFFSNIGTVDTGKARVKVFSGGWTAASSTRGEVGEGSEVPLTYVAFMSWDDEGAKERFKTEDRDWGFFLEKVEGMIEGVEREGFRGLLRGVSAGGSRAQYGFESETDDEE
ncbi:hypothetical protein FQN54_004915 [Arachnomyces sp. PD_36]|nr:hypothetical protein FQN54_004915 [Arachnomyces sp. PD_36]